MCGGPEAFLVWVLFMFVVCWGCLVGLELGFCLILFVVNMFLFNWQLGLLVVNPSTPLFSFPFNVLVAAMVCYLSHVLITLGY
jgi:hypothetical protein